MHNKKISLRLAQFKKKDQLLLTNPHNALHHGKRAANK